MVVKDPDTEMKVTVEPGYGRLETRLSPGFLPDQKQEQNLEGPHHSELSYEK